MPRKRKYAEALSDQMMVRLTPSQLRQIELLRKGTPKSAADVIREALDRFFENDKLEFSRHEKQTTKP